MAWALIASEATASTQWAQWADLEAAERWRTVLRTFVGTTPPTDYAQAAEGARRACVAIGNLARALDLPIQTFEPWARTLMRHDAGPDPLRRLDNNQVAFDLPPSDWRLDAYRRIALESESLREWGGPYIIDLYHRLGLTRDGRVVTDRLFATQAPDTPLGVDYRRQDAGTHGGTYWGGGAWAEWYPGFGEARSEAYLSWVNPLEANWAQVAECIAIIVDNDARALITRSRGYMAAKNLLTAQAVAGPGALPEDILEAASRSLQMHTGGPGMGTRAFLAVTAAALAPAGPIGVTAAAIAAGFQEALYAILGHAVAYQVDLWGRREPVLETPRLSGIIEGSRREAPSHALDPVTAESSCPASWNPSSTDTTYRPRYRPAPRDAEQPLGPEIPDDFVSQPPSSEASSMGVAEGFGLGFLLWLFG